MAGDDEAERFDWVEAAVGPPPQREEYVPDAQPTVEGEWEELRRQKAIAEERRRERRERRESRGREAAEGGLPAGASPPPAAVTPAAACVVQEEVARRMEVDAAEFRRFASLLEWWREALPCKSYTPKLDPLPAPARAPPAAPGPADRMPGPLPGPLASPPPPPAVAAAAVAVQPAAADRAHQHQGATAAGATARVPRHKAMLEFRDVAHNPLVADMHLRQAALLQRREGNARHDLCLREQLEADGLAAGIRCHMHIPRYATKSIDEGDTLITRAVAQRRTLLRRVQRLAGVITHDEEAQRGVLQSEEQHGVTHLQLLHLRLERYAIEGIAGTTLAIERDARLTRTASAEEHHAAFADLAAQHAAGLQAAADATAARLGQEEGLRDDVTSEESLARAIDVEREESCERDVLRSDFMMAVNRLTGLLAWRIVNAEARARWDVEQAESDSLDALRTDTEDGRAVTQHLAALLQPLDAAARLAYEEAGWRRLCHQGWAEGLASLQQLYASAEGWRGLMRGEEVARSGVAMEQALAAARMHSTLVDNVQWNLADSRAATPPGNPWGAVEGLVCSPAKIGSKQELESMLETQTHSLLGQWFYKSAPEEREDVPQSECNSDVTEEAVAPEVDPVTASWMAFADMSRKHAEGGAAADNDAALHDGDAEDDPWSTLDAFMPNTQPVAI